MNKKEIKFFHEKEQLKMIRTKSVKQSALIMLFFIICILSMGCTKTEMTKQEQTSTGAINSSNYD